MNRLEHIRELLESHWRDGTTHWDGCEIEHIDCAAWRLLGVTEAARAAMKHGRVDGSECIYNGVPAEDADMDVCDGDCDVAVALWRKLDALLDKLTVEIPE